MDPYLAGFLLGDGCSHKLSNGAYAVWVDQSVKNAIFLRRIKNCMRSYGKVHEYEYVDKRHGVRKRRVLVYSKTLFEKFRRLKADATAFIEGIDENGFMEFLSGLLDSDGTVTDRIVFYSSSRLLLEKISKRLERFLIKSHIYKFGKIFGLQVHDQRSLTILSNKLSSSKLRAPARLRNIGSRKTERF